MYPNVSRPSDVALIAVPHRVTVDDQYRGYDIPAGSTVIANTWYALTANLSPICFDRHIHRAMTRDTRFYPDPEEFRPERFMVPDGKKDELLMPSSFVFGFGRRSAALVVYIPLIEF